MDPGGHYLYYLSNIWMPACMPICLLCLLCRKPAFDIHLDMIGRIKSYKVNCPLKLKNQKR